MIRKLLTVSATALMMVAGSQMASAKTVAPGVVTQAPISTAAADGSYKVAMKKKRRLRNRRRNRRGNRGRNLGIGLGLAAGAIALGAAAAAAREREHGSCRRVERRCARRHGWETRRWYRCVEDRDC